MEEDDYDEIVKNIIMFLEGKQETLIKELKNKMQEAENLNFEKAAIFRNQVLALEKVLENKRLFPPI